VLQYRDPVSVQFAVRAIVKLGDDSAVSALLELFDSPDEMSRMAVCAYIGKMKLKDTRLIGDALMKKLDDPSPMVRSTATHALGELREGRAVPKLLAIAQRPAESTNDWFKSNLAAVTALGNVGDPAAVPGLVKLLDNPSQHQVVCEALARLGKSAAPPLLADFLRATNEPVRLHSLNALGDVGTKETVAALQKYLDRCPPQQKRAVRETIQKIEQRLSR
jgi:HEAT repeat protein